MAEKATPRRFTSQPPLVIVLQDPITNKIIAKLDDLKTSGFESTGDMTYPMGGAGNTYVASGFSYNLKKVLNITSATFRTEILAAQEGTEIVVGTGNGKKYDVINPSSTGAYKTSETAIGATGTEIGFVYLMNSDGTPEKTFTQTTATSAAAGQFTYTAGTNVIAFNTADTAVLNGGSIVALYDRVLPESTQTIHLKATGVPRKVRVTAYGLAVDTCSSEIWASSYEGLAQLDPNYTIDYSADGDPIIQSMNLTFIRGCGTQDLAKFMVFDDDTLLNVLGYDTTVGSI